MAGQRKSASKIPPPHHSTLCTKSAFLPSLSLFFFLFFSLSIPLSTFSSISTPSLSFLFNGFLFSIFFLRWSFFLLLFFCFPFRSFFLVLHHQSRGARARCETSLQRSAFNSVQINKRKGSDEYSIFVSLNKKSFVCLFCNTEKLIFGFRTRKKNIEGVQNLPKGNDDGHDATADSQTVLCFKPTKRLETSNRNTRLLVVRGSCTSLPQQQQQQ